MTAFTRRRLPAEPEDLIPPQVGGVTRWQAVGSGLSRRSIWNPFGLRRWTVRHLRRGVHALIRHRRTTGWAEPSGEGAGQAEGVHSLLARRYHRRVERPHALPRGTRRFRRPEEGAGQDDDVTYEACRTVVHLDGGSGRRHDDVLRNIRNVRGDDAAVRENHVMLRYGPADVTHRPCEVAAQVARVLIAGGWTGQPITCGPACAIRDPGNTEPPFPTVGTEDL